jgi:hypothetical protein
MTEIVRWYLEVAFLVVTCFALGGGAMAVALRLLLPEADPESEPDGPTYTAGAST